MTTALAPHDFPAFFEAVHGVPPFPWQNRLLRRLAEGGGWPEVLDLPTGSGKTAALDIAAFHLALEAARGAERRAPVRIVFVVDRRLIVDDAFDRAKKLQDTLRRSNAPILDEVAKALIALAGDNAPPLVARRLRGGAPREEDWALTPVQPTILCSTVDQVGSRLLFRGYGISDRMKPVHAGLLGSDCLILLDEAHLAEPFRQTLSMIARLRKPDAAPWAVAVLTATPEKRERVPFSLDEEDRRDLLLSQRLTVAKPARLIEIAGKPGTPVDDQRVAAIVGETKEMLRRLHGPMGTAPAIGVVLNRVARARDVFEELRREEEAEVALIIGPARPIEREDRLRKQLKPIRTGAVRELERPLIVVATQSIEAGVDIDFDGLVTEAAPLDALRQRFGRLNRAGRSVPAEAAILAHKADIAAKSDDPVYGERIGTTWKALQDAAGGGGNIDFGIAAFPMQLIGDAANLVSEKPGAPILLPAYADLWSQTSPIPNTDPDVRLFLHGPDRSPASIQVVWRADIRETDLAEDESVLEILKLMPPRSGEGVELPLWTVRNWLLGDRKLPAELSDASEREPREDHGGRGRPVFRYVGAEDERSCAISPGELRDGDLIVVPAEYGGCDQWGWHPAWTQTVKDVAETAALAYCSRRFAVRVTPELLRQQLDPEADGDAAAAKLLSVLATHGEERRTERVLDAIVDIGLPEPLRGNLERLKHCKGRPEHHFPYGAGDGSPRGIVFVAPFGLRDRGKPDEDSGPATGSIESSAPATESDDLGSTPGFAQPLLEHSKDVEDWALAFVGRAGLPDGCAADVALAAYLHDAGKADPRFQAYLCGGEPLGWDERRVLAKSGRSSLPRDAQRRAGLPDKWRHEALSVRLAQHHPRFFEARDPALVLWLVGVHHGLGRPLFPHRDPLDEETRELPDVLGIACRLEATAGPQSLSFDFAGRDWPQLFDELKRCYGIWGLARLEAVVRLADHRASEAAARRYGEDRRERLADV